MKSQGGTALRLIALALAVVVEGAAVISVVLHSAVAPLGTLYPNLVSVLAFVLPLVVGVLADRVEVAILLAALPFLVLVVVYMAVFAPVWTLDLYTIGVLAGRVAGALVLLGALGAVGWLARRVLFGRRATSLSVAGGEGKA